MPNQLKYPDQPLFRLFLQAICLELMSLSSNITVPSNAELRWALHRRHHFSSGPPITFSFKMMWHSRDWSSRAKTERGKPTAVFFAIAVCKRSWRLAILPEPLNVSLSCRDFKLTPIKEITSQFKRNAEVLHAGDFIWQGYQMPGREGTTSEAFKWLLKSVDFTTPNVSTHRPGSELCLRHWKFSMNVASGES